MTAGLWVVVWQGDNGPRVTGTFASHKRANGVKAVMLDAERLQCEKENPHLDMKDFTSGIEAHVVRIEHLTDTLRAMNSGDWS